MPAPAVRVGTRDIGTQNEVGRVRMIRPGQRLWLSDKGEPVFGTGICDLLAGVEATGSLHRAAANMKMSYSKAWTIVQRAEGHLGFPLIERRVGGAEGGGSALTDDGRWLMEAFRAWSSKVREASEDLFDEIFADRLQSHDPEG